MNPMSLKRASLRQSRAEETISRILSEGTGRIQPVVDIYQQAISEYREAIMADPAIARSLERTLTKCPKCERRCPGLPACERGTLA